MTTIKLSDCSEQDLVPLKNGHVIQKIRVQFDEHTLSNYLDYVHALFGKFFYTCKRPLPHQFDLFDQPNKIVEQIAQTITSEASTRYFQFLHLETNFYVSVSTVDFGPVVHERKKKR